MCTVPSWSRGLGEPAPSHCDLFALSNLLRILNFIILALLMYAHIRVHRKCYNIRTATSWDLINIMSPQTLVTFYVEGMHMHIILLVPFLLSNSKLNMSISTSLLQSFSFLCIVPLLKACSPPTPSPPTLSPPTNGGENVSDGNATSIVVWFI